MRTTVTLDSDIERLVKEAMQREHKSFKEIVNTALYQLLAGCDDPDEPPFTVKPKAMGLNSGLDITGFNKLADELEAEAFTEAAEKPDISFRQNPWKQGPHDHT
jgi:hypothetical protein